MPDFLAVVDRAGPMVEQKDTVLALLGASAGLSGFVLVFLGLTISTYQGFAGDTPRSVLERYRRMGAWTLGAFGLGLACLVVALVWLIIGGQTDLYVLAIVLFGLQLVGLAVATAISVRRTLWG